MNKKVINKQINDIGEEIYLPEKSIKGKPFGVCMPLNALAISKNT